MGWDFAVRDDQLRYVMVVARRVNPGLAPDVIQSAAKTETVELER